MKPGYVKLAFWKGDKHIGHIGVCDQCKGRILSGTEEDLLTRTQGLQMPSWMCLV